tara:strand:- start:1639 stop:1821 length:183 start_codon:yes stop_codon:yes gene_type:complete
MSNFIEFEEDTKILRSINLDDFSIEDLEKYINDLSEEIKRAKEEIKKREKSKSEAQQFFK